jgi:hypothetical protein
MNMNTEPKLRLLGIPGRYRPHARGKQRLVHWLTPHPPQNCPLPYLASTASDIADGYGEELVMLIGRAHPSRR